jgi:biopolymer transport protein ExbB/TolQ
MEMYRFAISHDWPVLLPIVLCSILVIGVTLERLWYFKSNSRGVKKFFQQFEKYLDRGPAEAKAWADAKDGIVPHVAAEGMRILSEHPDRFETLFEVASSLASRQLYRGLTIIGTIATISPYLGLFGTVVRILLTFGEMANAKGGGSDSASIMFGIGSALIATAAGLGVAIFAVAMNNYLQTLAEAFTKDFELVKLLCLSAGRPAHTPAIPRVTPITRTDHERRG